MKNIFLILLLVLAACATTESDVNSNSINSAQQDFEKERFKADEVNNAILSRRKEFLDCFNKFKLINQNKKSKMKIRFVIQLDGLAHHLEVFSTTINNSNIENCILRVVSTIQFPKPLQKPVSIVYPFGFDSK